MRRSCKLSFRTLWQFPRHQLRKSLSNQRFKQFRSAVPIIWIWIADCTYTLHTFILYFKQYAPYISSAAFGWKFQTKIVKKPKYDWWKGDQLCLHTFYLHVDGCIIGRMSPITRGDEDRMSNDTENQRVVCNSFVVTANHWRKFTKWETVVTKLLFFELKSYWA